MNVCIEPAPVIIFYKRALWASLSSRYPHGVLLSVSWIPLVNQSSVTFKSYHSPFLSEGQFDNKSDMKGDMSLPPAYNPYD